MSMLQLGQSVNKEYCRDPLRRLRDAVRQHYMHQQSFFKTGKYLQIAEKNYIFSLYSSKSEILSLKQECYY
ncbi:Hypothetical predicted protein [Octopus vulgaris]|uniref:Uncharacterized protein n=1 Tax=Octopus vulgaris TaxID=6645 RepID=A0AA36AZZ0_OCTVU|nr:Hypothetical predicted protein [Octopus vulgaris]